MTDYIKNEPLVSVLIPAYNHQNYVRHAVESVWKQKYKNIEIIVIDDGSSDSTFDILCELAAESVFPIKLYRQANCGLPATLNKLLKLANGIYVKFLASDDALSDTAFLGEHVEYLVAHPECSAVYGPRELMSESGAPLVDRARNTEKYKDPFVGLLFGRAPCMLQQMTINAVAAKRVGFDENLVSEDYDFILRFTQEYNIKRLKSPSVCYRVHNFGLSKNSKILIDFNYLLSKVENDPRVQKYNKNFLLARQYFSNCVYFSVTGDKLESLKYFMKGLALYPAALFYVPMSIVHLVIPEFLRNQARRCRRRFGRL